MYIIKIYLKGIKWQKTDSNNYLDSCWPWTITISRRDSLAKAPFSWSIRVSGPRPTFIFPTKRDFFPFFTRYHGNGPCAMCTTGRLIYLKIGYFSPFVAAAHEPNIAVRPPVRESMSACVCVCELWTRTCSWSAQRWCSHPGGRRV